jgi:PKD repeat protein
MNNNLENLFKNKFENFESKPKADLWNKIDKDLNKFSLIKIASIIASIALVVVATILFFPKNNIENTITMPNNSSSEITNMRPMIVENDDNIVIINSNIYQIPQDNSQQNNIIVATTTSNQVKIKSDDVVISDDTQNIEKIYEGFELSANYGCCPLTVLVENQETNSDNLTWKINNVEYKNSDVINISLDKPGIYEIVLSREDDGEINTYNDVVTVLEQPIADFSIPENLFENKTVAFENLSQDATKFAWYVDNMKISQDIDPKYSFSRAGTYNVVLIAINEQKCSDTISKNIKIEKAVENIVFPTAFVPNKYGSNGGYYSTTSTENDVFYPVVFKDVKEYSLTIYNKNGEKVFETNDINQGWDGYFQSNVVENGVYIFNAKGTFSDGEEFQKQGGVTVYLVK